MRRGIQMRQSASSVAALLPPPREEATGLSGVAKMHRDQAAAKGVRGQRKLAARDAANTLAGCKNIVLGHIHPRWLRQEVESLLDAEVEVDDAVLAALRERGPR